MNLLTWNLILALFWMALTNNVSTFGFVLGFVAGFVALFLVRRSLSSRSRSDYFQKLGKWVSFIVFFLIELVKSALRVTFDIITPHQKMEPGVVAIPLEARTDIEITLLANLISLTPGSLSLDISEDRRSLFLHAMFIDCKDVEAYRASVKDKFEKRILELTRS